jgi:Recombination endonuclease VII
MPYKDIVDEYGNIVLTGKERAKNRRQEVKEHSQEVRRDWTEKNKEHIKQVTKAWYENNRESESQKSKVWREENKERHSEMTKNWRKENRESYRVTARNWYHNNPQKTKNTIIKKKYGISLEDYDILFTACGGVCEICGEPETAKHQNGSVKMLAVDHDHETDMVRGLLCSRCNTAIGLLRDRVDLLFTAAEYLIQQEHPGIDMEIHLNKEIIIDRGAA